MIRKNLAFLLALLLLLATLSGCAGQGVGDSSVPSTRPTVSAPTGASGNTAPSVEGSFPDGPVTTVDLSTAGWISGNRIMETPDGYYSRIGTGYLLRYADKSDLSNWVVVCNRPNCNHDSRICPANIGTIFLDGDRLYSIRNPNQLGQTMDTDFALCSMALDGTDLRVEFPIAGTETVRSGYGSSTRTAGNMLCFGFLEMQNDGSVQNRVVRVTSSGSEIMMETDAGEFTDMVTRFQSYWSTNAVTVEALVYPGSDGKEYHNCRMTATEWEDISKADQYGDKNGFLFGDYLYRYVPNDGYYVTQLSTGASKRQMDAQLKDAVAYRLTDQWTLETNMDDNAQPEVPEIRIFNGSEWKSVEVPEEYAAMSCFPEALSTEHLFVRFYDSSEDRYCYISLADETYTLHPFSFTEKE